ncbi:MAG TPA: AlwI family type II restriction endonuclease [Ktedonobacteraceae bacterium]|nr:AlwI family type II restriction endonuclease [Ktedonobacteraceae bacterium]
MKTWNIGNTTVRNPYRLRAALQLFRTTMGGRRFGRAEQQEYLNLRPFRLLLRFLKRIREEGLTGLTKFEIALYVINMLDEDDTGAFEEAISNIRGFRSDYDAIVGKVRKSEFTNRKLAEVASRARLQPGSLVDYADSNARYALITGLLTLQGNKLALSETRLPQVEAIIADGTTLVSESEYLDFFYDPHLPLLPTDNLTFLRSEIARLEAQFVELASQVGESTTLPSPTTEMTISALQAYEIRLRDRLREVKEIVFYRNQCSATSLNEIEDLLENLDSGTMVLFGGSDYAPAFLEWAIWRLFLALNEIVGPVSKTRGFRIDDDINPIHHAKGGDADLTFTYADFKLVCEMTLMGGSRQFSSEGEPVTRHVFKAIEESDSKPVYGLFVAKRLDPNTIDAFFKARYWKNFERFTPTSVVALEIGQVLKLIERIKSRPVSIEDIRMLFDRILQLQNEYPHGPAWYKAYSAMYEQWVSANSD